MARLTSTRRSPAEREVGGLLIGSRFATEQKEKHRAEDARRSLKGRSVFARFACEPALAARRRAPWRPPPWRCGRARRRRAFRRTRRRATGRAASRSAIPIPISSRSTRGSAATSSATRRSGGCTPATLWAEGPAWNGVGRYLVWSDIPNNVQLRWIEDDGHVTRSATRPATSNGNTFDREGRQISCEHGNRRVVRYEHDGTVTVLADRFNGKPPQRPERRRRPSRTAASGSPIPATASEATTKATSAESELKEAVYRIDPKTGKLEQGHRRDLKPNGLCFSPDYKKLYIADTGTGREIAV